MADARTLRVLVGLALLTLCACGGAGSSGYRAGVRAWERHAAPDPMSGAAHDPAAARPVEPGADADLGELLRFAERNNPGLHAAAQRWRAALERVPQAEALPDPRLNFGYFLDEVETRTGPMQWRVGLSQSFPWPGTLDAAGRAAAAEAEAARERFLDARLEVGRRVREAWAELAWVHAALEVTRGHLELLSRWEQVARSRYATGLAPEADVLRAQVELGKLGDRVRGLEDLRRPVAARLNAALGRPPGAALPAPPTTVARGDEARDTRARAPSDADADRPALDEAALLDELALTHPGLRAAEQHVAAAEHRVELADRGAWPDLSLGVDYTNIGSARTPGTPGSGDDAVALTAGLSIPLQRGRIDGARRRARAESAAARAELAQALNEQRAELELALYERRDAERRLALYRDTLVPKGRESVETTSVAYQGNRASFLELIDAERVLLEFQLAVARARADHAQALARLERLTGVPLHSEAEP